MGKKANPIVSMEDFVRALNDIIPMFGRVSNDIQMINSTPFIFWDEQLRNISSEILSKISGLNKGNISTILITGQTYIGKTKFVANVVKQSGVPCVKMITTEKLLKAPSKSLHITNTFEQCIKADTSILVFDGLERLIEWMPIGPRFNNDVLQTIMSVITSQMNPSKKSILIFTANDQIVLENLGMFDLFDTYYIYPTMITSDEIDVHFPDIGEKCKFQDIEEISNVFKYMKYV